VTVTELGSEGRSRDQRTWRFPIFGKDSRPLAVILNFELRVNRIDCRESFFNRNRGGATLRPLRFPVSELKKFR
jgi:hypothetical protein